MFVCEMHLIPAFGLSKSWTIRILRVTPLVSNILRARRQIQPRKPSVFNYLSGSQKKIALQIHEAADCGPSALCLIFPSEPAEPGQLLLMAPSCLLSPTPCHCHHTDLGAICKRNCADFQVSKQHVGNEPKTNDGRPANAERCPEPASAQADACPGHFAGCARRHPGE